MASVLITGAAGFIGSHLTQRCLEEGHRVRGIDCLTSYYAEELKRENLARIKDPGWEFIEADLVELDLTSALEGVEIVYHLAAQPGVRASWGQAFEVYVTSNVTALQRLLEASTASGRVDRFVFASSSSVYGDAERLPTSEEASLQPISPYGATKVLGEHLCRLYNRSYALPTVVLRYFTVYGPCQRPDMAFNKLIRAAINNDEIVVYGDGEQTRDFTFVADAVAGTVAAAAYGHPGSVYNLGGGSRTSMNQVLDMIAELTGQQLNVRRVEAQAGDARDTAADTNRARAQLGFSPSHSLREGLAEQIAWHRGDRDLTALAPALVLRGS